MNGTVESFNRRFGYGFIVDDNDNKYFVHRNDIKERLYSGLKVSFEPRKSDKGYFAINIRVIKDMEIGSWIDYGDKIIEITSLTKTDIIGREVLHMAGYKDLKYGDTIIISRNLVEPIQNPA